MNWRESYQQTLDNPPMEGDTLKTKDGSPIRVHVELKEGQPPFLFARAYVPNIVGEEPGWFVRGMNDEARSGWMAILLPKSRSMLVNREGITKDVIQFAGELRVVRKSRSGNSLLCELITEHH